MPDWRNLPRAPPPAPNADNPGHLNGGIAENRRDRSQERWCAHIVEAYRAAVHARNQPAQPVPTGRLRCVFLLALPRRPYHVALYLQRLRRGAVVDAADDGLWDELLEVAYQGVHGGTRDLPRSGRYRVRFLRVRSAGAASAAFDASRAVDDMEYWGPAMPGDSQRASPASDDDEPGAVQPVETMYYSEDEEEAEEEEVVDEGGSESMEIESVD